MVWEGENCEIPTLQRCLLAVLARYSVVVNMIAAHVERQVDEFVRRRCDTYLLQLEGALEFRKVAKLQSFKKFLALMVETFGFDGVTAKAVTSKMQRCV